MDSILESCKKLLGTGEGYEYYDADIIMCINSALSTAAQLGIGPAEGFTVTGSEETWSEITHDKMLLGFLKPYVFRKVKVTFDPPSSSFVLEALNKQIEEDEWRMNAHADTWPYDKNPFPAP